MFFLNFLSKTIKQRIEINYQICHQNSCRKVTAQGLTRQDCHHHLSFCVPSQHRACQIHQIHNLQQRGSFHCKCSPSRAINVVNRLITTTCRTSIHNMKHVQMENGALADSKFIRYRKKIGLINLSGFLGTTALHKQKQRYKMLKRIQANKLLWLQNPINNQLCSHGRYFCTSTADKISLGSSSKSTILGKSSHLPGRKENLDGLQPHMTGLRNQNTVKHRRRQNSVQDVHLCYITFIYFCLFSVLDRP